ncbi:MAG: MgtC/SapB family protein [Prochlorococcaceae cyanobacterium]
MSSIDFVIRLSVAFLLGSSLGLERQLRERCAGLRTNALVATGAALFVMLSVLIPGDGSPTRMPAQIISGIGFLAGGVILKEGLNVRGLNTAATLWCAAAVGSLAGSGFLQQAMLGSVAVLIANTGMRRLINTINQQSLENSDLDLRYVCTLTCHSTDEGSIRSLLLQSLDRIAMNLRSLRSEPLRNDPHTIEVEAELVTKTRNNLALEQNMSRLCLDPRVSSARWQIIEPECG